MTIVLLLIVAGTALAQTIAQTTFPGTSLFTGQVGIGLGDPGNPYGMGYPLTRLDVSGDTNTRIRIDGSNTTGLFFTRGGADAGTIRATANGIEVWTSDNTLVWRLQGNQVTIFADLHVTGKLQTDGNIASKFQQWKPDR